MNIIIHQSTYPALTTIAVAVALIAAVAVTAAAVWLGRHWDD